MGRFARRQTTSRFDRFRRCQGASEGHTLLRRYKKPSEELDLVLDAFVACVTRFG
jgi:chemotaxis methyl-accepting protein methylase